MCLPWVHIESLQDFAALIQAEGAKDGSQTPGNPQERTQAQLEAHVLRLPEEGRSWC